jgi:hypothetical protein
MRITEMHLLMAATLGFLCACGSGEDTKARLSTVSAPASSPLSAASADEPPATSEKVSGKGVRFIYAENPKF